jgi:hypothetical protein
MFETKCRSKHVYYVAFGVIELCLTTHVAKLWRVINTLNVASNTFWVVGVLAIVAIQVAHTLLNATSLFPIANELSNVGWAHETNVVHVSPGLTIETHCCGDTFLAGSLGVRLMIVGTTIVYFVTRRGHKGAVGTFSVDRVRFRTLFTTISDH